MARRKGFNAIRRHEVKARWKVSEIENKDRCKTATSLILGRLYS
jgi:hypothetical protein